MKTLRRAPAPAASGALSASAGPPPGQLPIETRAFWVRFAVLSVVVTTAFVGWYAYVTRKVPAGPASAPPPALARAAPAAPVVPAKPPQAPVDDPKLGGLAPVRAAEALDPAERIVLPGPVQPSEPAQAVHVPRNEPYVQRVEPPPKKVAAVRPASPGPDTRHGALDPRPGCAHLHFIAASRCEANQCAKPQYYRHPHCAVVREQTRRDVARRDPLQLGF
ncbi:hypothetical protein [Variovorax defluvii]